MAIQGISRLDSAQPLRGNQAGKENVIQRAPRFTMAYVPSEIYDNYCTDGYCSGKFLDYFA